MSDYHSRTIAPILTQRLTMMPVVAVTGARQTGKTTLVERLSRETGRDFRTLDSLTTLDQARRAPQALVAGPGPFTLDEVQRAPELLLAVKEAVDRDRRRGRFLLTGSANLLLMKSVADSLSGRVAYLTLRPLTEREKREAPEPTQWTALLAARSAGDALDAIGSSRPLDWRSAVLAGGLPPAALASNSAERAVWFDGYVETYVTRDVRDLTQVGDLAAFVRLMRSAFLRVGGLLNVAELGRDASVPRATAQRWLSILETSYLITLVPSFARSRHKRVILTPRLYAGDTGLGLFLAGIQDKDELEASRDHGGLWLENLVLNDLLSWRETLTRKPEVYYSRTVSDVEVDFVVEHGRRLLPIEVKATQHPRVGDGQSIEAFCEEMGASAPFGVLVYGGNQRLLLSPRVVAAPLGSML